MRPRPPGRLRYPWCRGRGFVAHVCEAPRPRGVPPGTIPLSRRCWMPC